MAIAEEESNFIVSIKLACYNFSVHLLEPKVHFLNSEVDSLTKKKYVLEETIKTKKVVLEKIKDCDERKEV